MYAEPADIDRRDLVAALNATWGLRVSALRYEPLGFGSHHYIASDGNDRRWFVTVDDLTTKRWLASDADAAFAALEGALRTAIALRRAHLEFVHAPVESEDGTVLARIDERYAASVFALIEASSTPFGEGGSVDGRRLLLHALGRMHAALPAFPAGFPRRETLAIPLRNSLLDALDDRRSTWTGGPFSEPTRRLLVGSKERIKELLDRYDELASVVLSRAAEWVITHGEPHGANVMRTGDGALLLVDWDTVAVGPRERDLWMVEPRGAEDWAAYASAAPANPPDPATMELYRLMWQLAEIAGYTATLRLPHEDDANNRAAWANLQSYVPTALDQT